MTLLDFLDKHWSADFGLGVFIVCVSVVFAIRAIGVAWAHRQPELDEDEWTGKGGID